LKRGGKYPIEQQHEPVPAMLLAEMVRDEAEEHEQKGDTGEDGDPGAEEAGVVVEVGGVGGKPGG